MLKESEENYSSIFESTNDGIMLTDIATGKIISANHAVARMLGYNLNELIGMSALELYYDPETRKSIIEELKKTGYATVNFKLKKKGGDLIHILGSCHLKEDRIESILKDITKIKEAEKDLKKSEEKYSVLFNLSRDAIMTLSPPDWKFTSGNSATVKMFNAKDEKDFISKAPWEVSPEKQLDGQLSSVKANKMIEKAMKEGSNFFEWTHKRINGQDFPATVLLSRVEIGGKALLQATVRDITEIKKAEEVLKESEEKFSKLFNLSPNVNIITTFGEGVILDVNKAFEDELGIPREKVIGMKLSDFNFIDSKTRKDAYARLEKEGFSVVEINGIVKGQKRFGRIFAKAIEFNGKKCIFQSIIDITEQKLAEEKINENEKKLRESLAMSAKQNIQLSRLVKEKTKMQEKLHEYAEQLEVKVKTLENKIPLTSKEKLVFYGITAWPMLNDKQLSQKLKLKRSTVTAIKNRLREEKWFFAFMVPNFYALGCEMCSLIHCNFNTNMKERKNLGITDEILNHPEIVFFGEDDNKAIGLFVSKKFISIKKYLDNSLMTRQNVLNKEMEILSFFSELSIVKKPDFSGILNKLFDLNFPKIKKEIIETQDNFESLNKNERRALCAFVEFPEYSIDRISQKLWLSKPTVSTIKKKLIAENFLMPLIIPNLSRLPIDLGLIMSSKFNPSISKKVNFFEKDIEQLEHSTILKIIGNNEITSLMLFRNKEECDKEIGKLKEFSRKKNILPLTVKTIFFPTKGKSMSAKLDFLTLTKNLVFPESF